MIIEHQKAVSHPPFSRRTCSPRLAEDRHIFTACHDPEAVNRESIVRMREMLPLDPKMVRRENIVGTWEMRQSDPRTVRRENIVGTWEMLRPDPEGAKLDSPGHRPGQAGNAAALAL